MGAERDLRDGHSQETTLKEAPEGSQEPKEQR